MSQATQLSIREVLLETIKNEPKASGGGPPNRDSVLNAAAKQLGFHVGDQVSGQALLTEWNDLIRTGFLAWGKGLTTPDPPWFHVTDRGRKAMEKLSRDPSNPAGYLRHLANIGSINPVAQSYLTEALDCYITGLFKSAAVMVGTAAESVMLDLRDAVVRKLTRQRKPVPAVLRDWKIKTVTDGLATVFDGIDRKRHRELRESYEAYWAAFSHQIRTSRNEAGHPKSIDPVTSESVHASLLVFPEVVRLASALSKWIVGGFR